MALPNAPPTWDPLPWRDWADTIATLHMWTQIAGKIRMALTPPLNHWWHVTLTVSASGLSTGAIPYGDRAFQIDFDFATHVVMVRESSGRSFAMDLEHMSVATFYRRLMDGLASLSIQVPIMARPVEVPLAIPFEEDEQHATYDRDDVSAFWQRLRAAQYVLSRFRGGFMGKASPVHFFWGGFDLAVTRFSGRQAPQHRGGVPNCADWVMHEAYSHEVSSAGWWPASPDLGPFYYSYMYPEPDGFPDATVRPGPARYDGNYGEFLLRDDDLAGSSNPEDDLLAFLDTTYEAGATLARWDRTALESSRRLGAPGPSAVSRVAGAGAAPIAVDARASDQA